VKTYRPLRTSFRNKWNNFNDILEIYFPRSQPPVGTPYGFQMVTTRSMYHKAMLDGSFELDEVKVIQRHLTTVDVFIDAGANIGFYTCLARAAGKQAIAFEPLNRNLNYLYTNLVLNGWKDVEVFPLGLGSHVDVAPFYTASTTGASLIEHWAGLSTRFKQTIPVTTLDNVLGKRFSGKKLLIKIDVEGAEYFVVSGAQVLLQLSPKPLWFGEIFLSEHHPGGLNPYFARTFELFWKYGYETHTANEENASVTASDVDRWIRARKSDWVDCNYYIMIPKA